MTEENNLLQLSVEDLFKNEKYIIPIYQRNYAWGQTQIEQLLDDINSYNSENRKAYFLGNLIVNQRDTISYEVIDGQQRLTTLFLLKKYICSKDVDEIRIEDDSLQFEARTKSNETLKNIVNPEKLTQELRSEELINGFNIIEKWFESSRTNINEFIKKLNSVFIIQVRVPPKIDLNHYFEIMNTRGEQLEPHEIAKSRLLEKLKNENDRRLVNKIWIACSQMNSYVQMNFCIEDRKKIFSDNWTGLNEKIKDYDSLLKELNINNEELNTKNFSIKEIVEKIKQQSFKPSKDKDASVEEQERFESIISFPSFLLQTNATLENKEENDSRLDDKELLTILNFDNYSEVQAKEFIFRMLRCRILFDNFIVKREFNKDNKDDGKWSLKKIEKYHDKNKNSDKPTYKSTFSTNANDSDSDLCKQIKVLQALLRTTYTSPKTMHWIYNLLNQLLKNTSESMMIEVLENYCKEKVVKSDFENATGFSIQRIVFSYIDYILYRDYVLYKKTTNKDFAAALSDFPKEWNVMFRNSIEHFYPQNPAEHKKLDDEYLNSLGNLVLLTVKDNSRFSNLYPSAKISTYSDTVNQSLKLKVMAFLTKNNNGEWDEDCISKHEASVLKLLTKELEKLN